MTNEEIVKALASIETRLDKIEETLSSIDKALNGNGRPGVIERVTSLEKAEEGSNKNLGVLGWIITTLIAVYAAFIKHGH